MAGQVQDKRKEKEYAYASSLVQLYFRMLTTGCRDVTSTSSQVEAPCTSPYCVGSGITVPYPPADAAIKSIYMATQDPVPICERLLEHHQLDVQPSTDTAALTETYSDLVEQETNMYNPQVDKVAGTKAQEDVQQQEVHEDVPEVDVEVAKDNSADVVTDSNNLPEPPLLQLNENQNEEQQTSTPRRRISVAKTLDDTINPVATSSDQLLDVSTNEAKSTSLIPSKSKGRNTSMSIKDRGMSLLKKKLLQALGRSSSKPSTHK